MHPPVIQVTVSRESADVGPTVICRNVAGDELASVTLEPEPFYSGAFLSREIAAALAKPAWALRIMCPNGQQLRNGDMFQLTDQELHVMRHSFKLGLYDESCEIV